MIKRALLLSCATGALGAWATQAQAATATATAAAEAQTSSAVAEIVVTAEKREQALQTVPIAITAFTSKERDQVGINSIQDMTNFTPGLTYSTSTDRITLRGVGRTTNVLSADAPVANYDDDLYETFAVAAGRSSLDLATVEVLRGPQGTLGGRNALAGALNEITVRPTDTLTAEGRLTVGNYNHVITEAAIRGPINDVWKFGIYFTYEYQGQGWIQNVVPGMPSEGNNINEWYTDIQLSAHFNDHLEMWTKFQSAMWWNPSGGPGDQSAGWTPVGYPSYQWQVAGVVPLAGVACAPGFLGTNIANTSPAGCFNPALTSPWKEATNIDHVVELPAYYSINSQWTWHQPGYDIKFIGGGTYYHYILFGPTEGQNAPITAYTQPTILGLPGGLNIFPTDSFEYEESNGFWSDELNFISTGNSALQWVAGVYQFYQHYQQPVSAEDLQQPQLNGVPPFGAPGFFCAKTGGVCAPGHIFRWFDNRPDVQDQSYAVYGQIDWKFAQNFKLTLGIRYSYDNKYGSESVRLLCFTVPACFAQPELNPVLGPGGLPAVDLTQLGTVVASGVPGPLPKGVTSVTTYNPGNGLATRHYNASWQAPSGTAGLEWTPDSDSLYYFKYGRGYKSGGYNIGIFTVLSFTPWTDAEHVDSFELGAKHTFGRFLTANAAAYYYSYQNLQIPISQIQTAGGLAQSTTSFYNVPDAVSWGFELETTWTPIEHLTALINYSYDDAYVTKGTAADPADPNAVENGAQPLFTAAQCPLLNAQGLPNCTADVFSVGIPLAIDPRAGFNVPQNLRGNPLPNAPRNKVSVNVLYEFDDPMGGKWIPSVSYIWRDKEYGLFFRDHAWAAPSWDQWDARLSYNSPDGKFEAILFIKNIANKIGYDQGAIAARYAGTTDICNTAPVGGKCPGLFTTVNYVQGLNGPAGFNSHLAGTDAFGVGSTFYPTPPRTYVIEFHYKFF